MSVALIFDRHLHTPVSTEGWVMLIGLLCVIAITVALAAVGIRAVVHRIPNPGEPDRLATLELEQGRSTLADLDLATAITGRRTDRRPFSDWQIPEDSQRQLESAAVAQGAILRMVGAGGPRAALLEAIRRRRRRPRREPAARENRRHPRLPRLPGG